IARPVIADEPRETARVHLAYGHAIAVVRIEQLAPAAVNLVHLLEVPVAKSRPAAHLERRVVAQIARAHQSVGDVDAETVDPTIEPEPHDALHRLAHRLLPPAEVGLTGHAVVQVVLTGPPAARPGGSDAPEDGQPDVRRS